MQQDYIHYMEKEWSTYRTAESSNNLMSLQLPKCIFLFIYLFLYYWSTYYSGTSVIDFPLLYLDPVQWNDEHPPFKILLKSAASTVNVNWEFYLLKSKPSAAKFLSNIICPWKSSVPFNLYSGKFLILQSAKLDTILH
jgi:hypothetical protein